MSAIDETKQEKGYYSTNDTLKIDEVQSSLFPTPTKEYETRDTIKSTSKRTWTSKRTKLPADFHQNIIELENKFFRTQTIDIVEDLLTLYKVKKINLIINNINLILFLERS
jgi:hypothetical protein